VDEVANEQAVVDAIERKLAGEQSEPERLSDEPVVKPPEEEPENDTPPVAEEEPQDAPEGEDAAEEDTSDEPEVASLYDLAEGLGWEPDRLMSLKVKAKIDGEEQEVTLQEALASYQIQGHLTRKSMALSDERKAWEEARAKEEKAAQEKASKLEAGYAMAANLLNAEFANVDWQRLQQDDPIEFNSKYIQWQQHNARLAQLAEAIAHHRQEQTEAQQKHLEKLRSDEQKRVTEAIPSWSDPTTKEREWREIVDTAKEYGFTEDNVNEVFDHRVIRLLRDAKEYAKLQKAKPQLEKKLKLAPKMVKPGNAKKADTNRTEQLMSRAKKTGSVDDVAELLMSKFA
jgi:hypothetical protein